MNIFAFDKSPYQSALWLDDIRKNKMILESCQMLSTTVHVLDPDTTLPIYKLAYLNHPCSRWTRASSSNFYWLWNYTKHCLDMRGVDHKCISVLETLEDWFEYNLTKFPYHKPTEFANCTRNKAYGIDYTHVTDVHEAYQLYYIARIRNDKIKLTWKHGSMPNW